MRSPGKHIAWILLLFATAWVPPSGWALSAPDVRVVMDVSADMVRADPQNLRESAVGMLLQMLPDDARAGVWSFARDVEVVVGHGMTDRLWKQVADIHLAQLTAGGSRSNLVEALGRASWDVDNRSDSERHIVLLARGQVDISDAAGVNAAEEERLLKQLVPRLREAGFKIHTLALTDSANVALLKELSMSTQGTHARVRSADQLQRLVLNVLDSLTMSALIPTTADGGFRVDSGVRELTVLRLRDAEDVGLALLDPRGRLLNRTTPRSEIRWHKDAGYDLLSLADPAPGLWRFQGGSSHGDVRVVALGDISAQLVGVPGILFPGGPRTFEVYLLSNGRPLADREFLDLLDVRATLEGPRDSQPLVVAAGADGTFTLQLLEVTDSGDHVLRVSVRGPTFEREVLRSIAVRNPVTLDVRPTADGAVVWAEVNSAGVDFRSLRVTAKVRQPPGLARVVPAETMPGGLWKIMVEGTRGIVDVSLDISGNFLNKKNFRLKTEPMSFTFPVLEPIHFNLDLSGSQIQSKPVIRAVEPPASPAGGLDSPPAPDLTAETGLEPAGESGLVLPWWFALAAASINVLLVAALWWLLKPSRAASALPDAVADLVGLLPAQPEPA